MTSIMKEPNPNATIQIDALDLDDGPDKVSLEDAIANAKENAKKGRLQPPPLPPVERASQVPPTASAPAATARSGRGPLFYGVILLAVVGIGIVGGVIFLRATAPASTVKPVPSASASAAASVITIPTVEFGNE